PDAGDPWPDPPDAGEGWPGPAWGRRRSAPHDGGDGWLGPARCRPRVTGLPPDAGDGLPADVEPPTDAEPSPPRGPVDASVGRSTRPGPGRTPGPRTPPSGTFPDSPPEEGQRRRMMWSEPENRVPPNVSPVSVAVVAPRGMAAATSSMSTSRSFTPSWLRSQRTVSHRPSSRATGMPSSRTVAGSIWLPATSVLPKITIGITPRPLLTMTGGTISMSALTTPASAGSTVPLKPVVAVGPSAPVPVTRAV